MALPEKPITRIEKYLSKIAGEEAMLPENAITRAELYLAKIAGEEVETPAYPVTRFEQYLDYIAEKGGEGGEIGGFTVKSFTKEEILTEEDRKVGNSNSTTITESVGSALYYIDLKTIPIDKSPQYILVEFNPNASIADFRAGFVDSLDVGTAVSMRNNSVSSKSQVIYGGFQNKRYLILFSSNSQNYTRITNVSVLY